MIQVQDSFDDYLKIFWVCREVGEKTFRFKVKLNSNLLVALELLCPGPAAPLEAPLSRPWRLRTGAEL